MIQIIYLNIFDIFIEDKLNYNIIYPYFSYYKKFCFYFIL